MSAAFRRRYQEDGLSRRLKFLAALCRVSPASIHSSLSFLHVVQYTFHPVLSKCIIFVSIQF